MPGDGGGLHRRNAAGNRHRRGHVVVGEAGPCAGPLSGGAERPAENGAGADLYRVDGGRDGGHHRHDAGHLPDRHHPDHVSGFYDHRPGEAAAHALSGGQAEPDAVAAGVSRQLPYPLQHPEGKCGSVVGGRHYGRVSRFPCRAGLSHRLRVAGVQHGSGDDQRADPGAGGGGDVPAGAAGGENIESNLVYHYYGVPKYSLDKKMFGIFKQYPLDAHLPIFRGFDDEFYMPHSRHTEVRRDDILQVPGLEIIAESPQSGVCMVMARGGREIYVTGHSEYSPYTLDTEYKRDLAKGLLRCLRIIIAIIIQMKDPWLHGVPMVICCFLTG